MYVMIDWMTFGFVVEFGDGTIKAWDTKEEADKYGEDEMQADLWDAIEVPPFAEAFKP